MPQYFISDIFNIGKVKIAQLSFGMNDHNQIVVYVYN